MLRYPTNSIRWNHLMQHVSISLGFSNARLALSIDNFKPLDMWQPKKWPVILVMNNLPLWMCMKQPCFIMLLLIPRPISSGNDFNAYMRPFIEAMKELWVKGVNTDDAYPGATSFKRAILSYTINDFPVYVILSSWSTKGLMACPYCYDETRSQSLCTFASTVNMGHHLSFPNHKIRPMMGPFGDKEEHQEAPIS